MTVAGFDGLDEVALADIRMAIDGITERCEQYEKARDYDSVDIWDQRNGDSRLSRILDQASVEYDVNYCAPIIDAMNNGLTIESITARSDIELGAEDVEPDRQATALVNAIWRAQLLAQFWPGWQRNALRDGDGYLMCWPVADVADPLALLTPEELNVTYVDPMMGRLFYDEEDPRVKKYYAQLWSLPVEGEEKGRIVWRLNIMYPDVIYRYETKPMSKTTKLRAEMFLPYEDDGPGDNGENQDDSVLVNPFGVIPVWHLRTDVLYGRPVHENAYGAQDGIADTVERMMTTLAFQAWPQLWALQEAEKLAQTLIREDPLRESYRSGLDDFGDDLDVGRISESPEISNETGTDLEASPGGIMLLKGFKQVGQFEAADTAVFLEPWREFAKTAADTTGTPPWTFRAVGAEIPSGVALKIASQPQTARRARFAGLFGAALSDLLKFATERCGMPDLEVVIKWAPFEIVDEIERWTLVKLRRDAGVPLKHALMMAGIGEAEAAEWAEEADKRSQVEFERQQQLVAKRSADDKPPNQE